jgi:hypothetical protein
VHGRGYSLFPDRARNINRDLDHFHSFGQRSADRCGGRRWDPFDHNPDFPLEVHAPPASSRLLCEKDGRYCSSILVVQSQCACGFVHPTQPTINNAPACQHSGKNSLGVEPPVIPASRNFGDNAFAGDSREAYEGSEDGSTQVGTVNDEEKSGNQLDAAKTALGSAKKVKSMMEKKGNDEKEGEDEDDEDSESPLDAAKKVFEDAKKVFEDAKKVKSMMGKKGDDEKEDGSEGIDDKESESPLDAAKKVFEDAKKVFEDAKKVKSMMEKNGNDEKDGEEEEEEEESPLDTAKKVFEAAKKAKSMMVKEEDEEKSEEENEEEELKNEEKKDVKDQKKEVQKKEGKDVKDEQADDDNSEEVEEKEEKKDDKEEDKEEEEEEEEDEDDEDPIDYDSAQGLEKAQGRAKVEQLLRILAEDEKVAGMGKLSSKALNLRASVLMPFKKCFELHYKSDVDLFLAAFGGETWSHSRFHLRCSLVCAEESEE